MPMNHRTDLLQALADMGVLRPFDFEVGCCLLDLDADADSALGLIAAATSLAVSQGHSCLPLAHLADVLADAAPDNHQLPALPDATTLQAALQGTDLAQPADARATAPLLYNAQGDVWLGRYFHYERAVAEALRALVARKPSTADAAALRAALQPFFALDAAQPDRQALAALTGLVSPLTVITGGPGTGKTTTVLWLLAAWIGQRLSTGEPLPRIHLAAPTGKAAARLSESLRLRMASLAVDDAVRAAIPQTASTLHRLLGVRHGSSRFRHHAGHPLATDLVVIDEVSMVDLPLMAKLLDALPPEARLVLLGDRDQLASVEAGNVLAALCTSAGQGAVSPARAELVKAVTGMAVQADAEAPAFADGVVALHQSHRFDRGSGLGLLAALIRDGDADAVCNGLADGAFAGVNVDAAAATRPADALIQRHLHAFAQLAECPDAKAALALAGQRRILTALREGPSGSHTLNAAFERALRLRAGIDTEQPWYPGRLLLVTRNDYATELFNGDVGIVLPDDQGALRAWFPAAAGDVRKLALSALPECESAYAMTIHKAQGSEFDAVDIVLPQADARVLGRELLYTGVTRARTSVTLLTTEDALRRTIERSTRRYSGLVEMLGGAEPCA